MQVYFLAKQHDRGHFAQCGMTLLEILLYVSISGIVLFAASSVLSTVYEVRQKGQVIQAVEEEGTLVGVTLKNYAENAVQVFTPDKYKPDTRLMVTVVTNNIEQRVELFLEDGKLYSSIDNGEKVALTSDSVVISNLAFTFTGSSEKGFVGYSYTISSKDATGRNEYSRDFTGGASIR